MYVKDIMTKEVLTVNKDDTVEMCANTLNKYNLSGIPVVDNNNRLVGIVTESDLITRASTIEGPQSLEVLGGIFYLESRKNFMERLGKSTGSTANEIMTKNLITIGPDKKIEYAATLLVQKKIKRLPVVDEGGNLVGIISRKDIMNYLYDKNKV